MHAARYGYEAAMKVLLQEGADLIVRDQVSEGVSAPPVQLLMMMMMMMIMCACVCMCVCVWLVRVGWEDSAHACVKVGSRGSDEGAAAGGG
jgi:hypothetical protein